MCYLMDICEENQSKSFINIFVNNLLNNMKRSSNITNLILLLINLHQFSTY